MNTVINLLSDTVTKPTPAMLQAMMQAQVGDDVFGEDPDVNALQSEVAALFGHEAALFCPSGTMTNQIAIKVHTRPLDEMICDITSHVYQYESAGFGFHSGISVNLLQGEYGKITAEQVAKAVKPRYDWLPISRLVVLENTTNKGGGNYYTLAEIDQIRQACKQHNLAFHLDGARIFNACLAGNYTPLEVGSLFDSVSVCLSKGLGAPVGSLLLGNSGFIQEARRFRKVMGGGMRQAGYLAAAGRYALQHHVKRLEIDHQHAQQLGKALETCPWVSRVYPVPTNIIIFDVAHNLQASDVVEKLAQQGIKCAAFGPQTIRFVTHLDVSDAHINQTIDILKQLYTFV